MKANERIKLARKSVKASVKEAAEIIGVSIHTYRKWEAPGSTRAPTNYGLDGVLMRLYSLTNSAADRMLSKLYGEACPSCDKLLNPEDKACPDCGQKTLNLKVK